MLELTLEDARAIDAIARKLPRDFETLQAMFEREHAHARDALEDAATDESRIRKQEQCRLARKLVTLRQAAADLVMKEYEKRRTEFSTSSDVF